MGGSAEASTALAENVSALVCGTVCSVQIFVAQAQWSVEGQE